MINAEGICSLHPMLRTKIKWEEIDFIYRINRRKGAVFAVDLSPAGLISFFSRQGRGIPGYLNISEPQLALGIPETNLPLPVDQLLAQIRERFSAQLAYYHIDVDDRHAEDQEPE